MARTGPSDTAATIYVQVPAGLPPVVRQAITESGLRHDIPVMVMGGDTGHAERTIVFADMARPRLGAVLDQAQRRRKASLSIALGPYRFDPAALVLTRIGGAVVRLTEKERDILLALLHAEGNAVQREDLLHRVWGFVPGVETHTLETHIYRLRQKIESDPAMPELLLTDGDGYRINPAAAG